MLRFALLLLVVIAAALGIVWYSSQTLPNWYEQEVSQQEKLVEELIEQISSEGVVKFFDNKLVDVMNGQVVLSEVEFNALLISGLQSSQDGRRVLAVSDAVRARLDDGEVEIGAVIDLDKVAKISEQARDAVSQILNALPLLDQSKVFLSVSGQPIVRDGELALDNDFSIKIGAIPISSKLLAQMGVPVHKATESTLPIKYMSVKSIALTKSELILAIQPKI